MNSQESNSSYSPQLSNATAAMRFANQCDSFIPSFQPNFHINPTNNPYFSLVNQQFGSTFSQQGALNSPPFSIDLAQRSAAPNKRNRKKDSDTKKSNLSPTLLANKNWTKEEDVALITSWLYVSVDGDVGNNQKTPRMWERILQLWKEKMGDACNDARNSNALGCRWGKIQPDVNKFNGYYDKLERNPQSGTTPEDMRRAALRTYQECGDGKEFQFEHCWEILRKNPKWCSMALTKANENKILTITSMPTGENDHTTNPEELEGLKPVELERPQGRKGCKEKKRRLNNENSVAEALKNLQSTLEKQIAFGQEELALKREKDMKELELKEKLMNKEIEMKNANQKMKWTAQKLKMQEQEMKIKAEKRKDQLLFLSQDLNKLPLDMQDTYKVLRAQILMEWKKDVFSGENIPSNMEQYVWFEKESSSDVGDLHSGDG